MRRGKIKYNLKKIFKNHKYSILKLKKYSLITFELILKETNYIIFPLNFNERIYHIIYNLHSIPQCKICSVECKFININKGYQKYCSLKCSKQDPELIKKIKESNKKTYNKNKLEIQTKIKQTCLERFGVEEPNQLNEIKNKIKVTKSKKLLIERKALIKRKQTNIIKYGKKHYFQTNEFKEKNKLINNGQAHQTEQAQQKRKDTCLKKYGVDNYFKQLDFIDYNTKESREIFLLKLKKKLKLLNFELLDNIYMHNRFEHNWKCSTCGFIFINNWRNMCRGYLCTKCFPRNNTSIAEKEIWDLLDLYNIEYKKQDRKILYPAELDIFIPSKKIAIEYNGLYWHSEQYKNQTYHLNKTLECEKQGIQLIHIFEDEWIFKKDIVKSRLLHILGMNKAQRIHARKCIIQEIKPQIKNEFLEKYHIQGKDASTIKLGAFYNDILIAVMTFSKGNISKGSKVISGIWELNRFCSNSHYHIPGIVNKLLMYFKRNFIWEEIFSYADRRWSQGNLYQKIGFDLYSITKPNYWYLQNYKRIHRFNLRKRPDEPKDIPEWVLRQKEGYFRIWDCGSYKFIMKKKIK